jgi:hypothetical protein
VPHSVDDDGPPILRIGQSIWVNPLNVRLECFDRREFVGVSVGGVNCAATVNVSGDAA